MNDVFVDLNEQIEKLKAIKTNRVIVNRDELVAFIEHYVEMALALEVVQKIMEDSKE